MFPYGYFRYVFSFTCIIMFGLFFSAGMVTAQPANSERVSELDAIFSSWDSSDTPGCAVGVSKDGRHVLNRAWGMADLEHMVPNTPSTIFEAGSVSKQFVSASVILLALEGELSLEDDIRDYVPEMPDYGDVITLRHLMNHTSGLRDWGSVTSVSGWGRGNRTHNHDHVIDILSRQTQLNFPPGERYSYSNSGYNLLAIVVERVSGMPFADYSTQKIFEPLGMTSTQWRDDYTRIVKGRSSAYSGNAGGNTFTINRPIENVHGNGGLLTTVDDLLTWNYALSTSYFSDEFNRELHQQGVLNGGRTISYASGVMIDSDHGQPQVVHTGATSGYRAYLSYYPDQKLSVALLCNVTGANPGGLGSAVSKIFLGEDVLESEAEQQERVSLSEEELRPKNGIWIDPRNYRHVKISLENGDLKIDGGPALNPVSSTDFQLGNSSTTYRFINSEESERPFIHVIREGYPEEILTPVNSSNPDNSNLSIYTGTFQSPDAETELKIELEGDKLVVNRRPNSSFELMPVYEDAFLARGFELIRFIRSNNGQIAQFTYSGGRVYDLRFNRVAEE
ncbi:MAG: class A beta-lactamase-related serine hydrolase [Balneolaceae bacterium]|nr:MAG: class A beta-lactamase-related serine hydrolase [Balneolaceae bacterium]